LSRVNVSDSIFGSNPSPTVFVLRDDAEEGQSCENAPFAEQEAQPTEVGTDEENISSLTAENGSLRDGAMVKTAHAKTRTTSPCQGSPNRSHSPETLQVPYLFEFVPFSGHTCTGRGTIPLGTIIVSVNSNTENPSSSKYNTFQGHLNKYNHKNSVFADDPVELHHVTGVTLRSIVELSASVRVVRDMRERRMLVVILLKSYPGCQGCQRRGKLHDNLWL
jgi:hypothetical protein